MITTLILPVRSIPTNTIGLSGWYSNSLSPAQYQLIQDAMTDLIARVPSKLYTALQPYGVVDMITQSDAVSFYGGVQVVPDAVGLTLPGQLRGGARFWIWLDPYYAAIKTAFIHEWGHAVDLYLFSPNHVTDSLEFNPIWQRVLTLQTQYGSNYYYGWTNKLELFAELFCWHWWGHGPGASAAETQNADSMFVGLTAGPGQPADSITQQARDLITGLTTRAGALS